MSKSQKSRYEAYWAALSPEQKAKVKADVAAYKSLRRMGRRLLDKHGLKRWEFQIAIDDEPGFFAPGAQLHGQCSHSEKIITLHHELTRRPRDAKQVILHEIAHILTRRRYGKNGDDDHGPKWCKIARKIGCRTWSTVGQYEWAQLLKDHPDLAAELQKERETR